MGSSAEPAAALPHLAGEGEWTDEDLSRRHIPVVDVPLITVGGGLGSLAAVQVLRTAGVPRSSIRVLSINDLPHETFRSRAEASQIDPEDPLRSASDATPDNVWGWPGYALRQAIDDRSVRPLWAVLAEPVLGEYYNPRARAVYTSIEREAQRLEWPAMVTRGQVRLIRRRAGGGYFVVQLPARAGPEGASLVYRAAYVHLAVGYAGPRYLPDALAYRARYGNCFRVANAYEPHDYVYEQLRAMPGVVIVRGAGIVASRVLQRLLDDCAHHGAQTTVLHVFRSYSTGPTGPRFFRRDGADGFSYQPFNFPKAAFSGQLQVRLRELSEGERVVMLGAMGGTSTARREYWRKQIVQASSAGRYRQYIGELTDLERSPSGRLSACLNHGDGSIEELEADYLIDATGLDDDVHSNPLLGDILAFTGARVNLLGRLDVEPTFELRGTRNAPGRLYASGAATLGGPYAPVDSFLGLQYAALAICDDLARLGFCRRIGIRRSVTGWWRWMRHQTP